MDSPQTATVFFLGPVAVAYLAACAGWLGYDYFRGLSTREPPLPDSDRPLLDFLLAIVAAAGILGLGEVYRRGWLLPAGGSALGRVGWLLDNLIIFSPIALVLTLRRQSPRTIFVSSAQLGEKVGLGLLLGVMSLAIYSALRGEADQIPVRLQAAVQPDKLVDFLPVFLEGVAVAFGFVRFRWLVGTPVAVALPSLLFAAAHVPGQLAEERTLAYMAVFLVFNTALCGAILLTVARSRDVIWLGIVHYLLDVAIEAV